MDPKRARQYVSSAQPGVFPTFEVWKQTMQDLAAEMPHNSMLKRLSSLCEQEIYFIYLDAADAFHRTQNKQSN